MPDPITLRELILGRLRSGELPAHRPSTMRTDAGGGTCDGCTAGIADADIACGLEYPGRTVRLHLECAGLWAALRLNVRPDLVE